MNNEVKANNLFFIYYEHGIKKETDPINLILEKKDKLLILEQKELVGDIFDILLGKKKETKIEYLGQEVNSFYPKEYNTWSKKVTIIDNGENKKINKNKKLISQLRKEISLNTDLKKNIYDLFSLHQKEVVKEYKKEKKKITEEICKEKVLTINEGKKEYKKKYQEEKNRLIINKLEARNEFIATKTRLKIKLNQTNIQKEIKYNSSQIKEEINKVAKEIKFKNLSKLEGKYNSCSKEEKKLINLLFAFCGKKDILIYKTKTYDQEELKIINKLINEKDMILVYITSDTKVDKTKFNKEIII